VKLRTFFDEKIKKTQRLMKYKRNLRLNIFGEKVETQDLRFKKENSERNFRNQKNILEHL
jgi:hypothetical protein